METEGMPFKSDNYINRELSWLMFNERVLAEAENSENLLFERLKFLSITASNLDEFFMIRVASLKRMQKTGIGEADITGMTCEEQFRAVSEVVHSMQKNQYCIFDKLLKRLSGQGITPVSNVALLSESEKALLWGRFQKEILPILSPIVIERQPSFPLIRNGFIYAGAFISNGDGRTFSFVQVPKGIERLVKVSENRFVLLEDIIGYFYESVFDGYSCEPVTLFRVLKNADLTIEDTFDENILNIIEKKISERDYSEAVKLDLAGNYNEEILRVLSDNLNLSPEDVYITAGPIDLTFLMDIYNNSEYERFRKADYIPIVPLEFEEKRSLFEQIDEHDLMLVHPFESFKPVVDFIEEASNDENVLAIKQSLYRVSGDSPIVKALVKAAQNGKQVTVLVELKARFDEAHNINWARILEAAGCNVIYGFENIKTHCKITLVIRKSSDGLRSFVHLGTGNYNDSTAKLYTDISFFTANEAFGKDAENVFKILSGIKNEQKWNKITLAPTNLRDRFIELINREIEHAKNERANHIVAKMNSLCDKELIDALYKASEAGVKIDLIVRGICSLKPGIPGLSDNITVRSIVGNYLEHSRIFYFKNGGQAEYYCSSADWMPRNMDRRIEILFPVERQRLREKLYHVLRLMMKDNRKAWILQPDGTYRRINEGEEMYSFQEGFFEEEIMKEERK